MKSYDEQKPTILILEMKQSATIMEFYDSEQELIYATQESVYATKDTEVEDIDSRIQFLTELMETQKAGDAKKDEQK